MYVGKIMKNFNLGNKESMSTGVTMVHEGILMVYSSRLVPKLLLRIYQAIQLGCLLQLKQEERNLGILLTFNI